MTFTLRLPHWGDVLIAIYNSREHHRYAEKLNRKIKGSLTYLRNLTKAMDNHNLIQIMPISKTKYLAITERGHKVIDALQIIKYELTSKLK